MDISIFCLTNSLKISRFRAGFLKIELYLIAANFCTMVLKNLTIRRQLVLLISIAVLFTLVFTSILIYTLSFRNYRLNLLNEMLSVAQMVGINSQAGLAFDIPSDAKEQLSKLSVNKDIQIATILTPTRKVFANYISGERPQWVIIPAKLSKGYRFGKSHLEIVKEIFFDGDKIAIVYLKVSLDTIKEQLSSLMKMLVVIVLLSYLLALAAIFTISKYITAPILNLAKTTMRISNQKDYSLRVPKMKQRTEIGILYNGFNEMLNVIESQNNEILVAFMEISDQKSQIENQKLKIEKQSVILEQWNKDISSSISYAKTIQHNMLLPINRIRQMHRHIFLYYEPRDIVSGDFYWFDKTGPELIICAADCTGHGVPGAMISVIGFNLLNQIVKAQKIKQPNVILDLLDEEIRNFFRKEEAENASDDGMDLSLCLFNEETLKLYYSGANNPVIIIRSGEVIELSPDKHPLGSGKVVKNSSYSLQEFQLQKGDSLYLFTDGYADQFGGPKGKKFMKKRFKEMLVEINSLSTNDKMAAVYGRLEAWKGDLQQVDDILVIGMRV